MPAKEVNSEWEDLMSNGAITKKTLRAVDSDIGPEYKQYVHIHIIGKISHSGSVFIDTYAQNEPLSFPLGDKVLNLVDNGVMLAIKCMKKREICAIKVDSRFGYGSQGLKKDGNYLVPPDSNLEYRVELLEIGDYEILPGECDIEQVKTLVYMYRSRGNYFYRQGAFNKAEACYNHVIKFLQAHISQLDDDKPCLYESYLTDNLSNLAACYEKQDELKKGLEMCMKVHVLNPNKLKNILRMIRLTILQGSFDEAKIALEKAIEIDKDNSAVISHKQKLRKAISEYKSKKNQMYSGFLDNPKKTKLNNKNKDTSNQEPSNVTKENSLLNKPSLEVDLKQTNSLNSLISLCRSYLIPVLVVAVGFIVVKLL